MYCNKCGRPLREGSVFCEFCGAKVAENAQNQGKTDDAFHSGSGAYYGGTNDGSSQYNSLAIVGFVLSIVGLVASFPALIAGLVCSVIGMKQCKKTGENGYSFAVAGTVIGSVILGLQVLILFVALIFPLLFGIFLFPFI